jgi:magnesium transporter
MANVRPPVRVGLPLGPGRRTNLRPPREPEGLRVETITNNRLTWVNVERPTEAEIEYLRQNYTFHPLDLDDCLSPSQTPKIDEYEDYLFLVLHFPRFNAASRVTTAAEVDIFVGENYVVTVHNGTLKPLTRFFAECQHDERIRKVHMGRSSGYLLYQILDRLIDYCFPILNKITDNVDRAEESIFDDSILDNVKELSVLRRDIISYRRVIKPQKEVIKSLEQRDVPFLKEDLDVYFGDLSDHMTKIWDSLEDLKEVVEGLYDTNNTLSSHRLNDILRVLTVISVVLLPLNVITGIYGMNISILPFAESEFSFGIVTSVMFMIVVTMIGVFRLNRWI